MVDEEYVCNGDLCYGLADSTTQPRDEIAADKVSLGVCLCKPDDRRQLDCGAEQIQWSTAIFVDKRDKKDAANGQSSIISCRSGVQEADSKAQLGLVILPGHESNVELDEGHEHIKEDYREIEGLAPGCPIQRIIWIRRRDGM